MTDEKPKTLMESILAVQREAPTLQKDKINPAFKSRYLSLDALMEQVLPLLTEHGLVWITRPMTGSVEEGLAPTLHYELLLASSQTNPPQRIAGVMPLMLDKQNSQGLGSAITYARRQSIMAVLGFTAGEDDDGNKASERPRTPPSPTVMQEGTQMTRAGAAQARAEIIPTEIKPSPEDRMLTDEELSLLLDAVKDTPNANLDLLLASEGVDSPNLLTVAQGRRIFKKIGVK